VSRIERVTVYREGARVERVLSLEEGATEARFTGLPLTLDDGSLRAQAIGGSGALALDVRVGLEVPDVDPSLAPAEDAALESAKREAERCHAEVTRLQLAVTRLESLKVVPRPQPRENEPPLPIPLESRQKLLALRTAEEQRLGAALAAANAAIREADKKLADATDAAKRATNARNAKEHELRKVATVTLVGAGKGTKVALEYAVPSARWSASYVLTLAGAKTTLGMRALVAQRSGEDWRDVRLQLSTAAADVWAELPELAKARIGRAQPHAKKGGYREPPEGAQALYADYDRIAGPLTMGPPSGTPTTHGYGGVAKAELAKEQDEDTAPDMMLGSLRAPGAGGSVAGPPPVTRAVPMPQMMMPMRPAAKGAASILAAPAALIAAPMAIARAMAPAKSRRRTEPDAASTRLEEFGVLSEAEELAPADGAAVFAPDWGMAAESLAYGRLRMRGPNDPQRGELTLVAQSSVYVEALGARVKVDVAAAIHVAFTRAQVNESALPPGYELAQTNDAYDYLYEAKLPCDVASDGAFHSIPVADWDAETKVRYVATPREAQQVYRMLDISSPIDAALLSGPLDVYEASSGEDAIYRTTTRMPPTPPRGRVEIGLGVEPAIKVARTTTFQEETAGLLGGSLALAHRVSVELRNLLPRPVTVEVRERVPVVRKDDAEVKIEVGAVEPSWEKWDQEQSIRGGHLWTVTLEPGATRTLSAKYTIKISSKLELVGGNRRES